MSLEREQQVKEWQAKLALRRKEFKEKLVVLGRLDATAMERIEGVRRLTSEMLPAIMQGSASRITFFNRERLYISREMGNDNALHKLATWNAVLEQQELKQYRKILELERALRLKIIRPALTPPLWAVLVLIIIADRMYSKLK